MDPYQFAGGTAVVTGAASGIGEARRAGSPPAAVTSSSWTATRPG
jgi:hypothetical protein